MPEAPVLKLSRPALGMAVLLVHLLDQADAPCKRKACLAISSFLETPAFTG